MSNFLLKKLSPKKLFHRLILIFFIPLIVTQISAIFFFYERHWEKIVNRFANIASNEITFIVNELEKNEAIDKKLLRYLTVRVKKFDLETNYFSKKDENEKRESSKN